MKVSITGSGSSYFMIESKIPLVTKETYQMDKVVSLPHKSDNIECMYPYIAFNLQKDLLITLSENDLQSCIHSSTNHLLCSINKPIYELQITPTLCNINVNKTMCLINRSVCQERWIKLHTDNMWLYSCCEKCPARFFCADKRMTMKSLTGNGLLRIEQGCTLKTDSYSIVGHNHYLSKITVQNDMLTVPEISILNQISNKTMIESYEPEDHIQEWLSIKSQIQDLKNQADAPLGIHDIHQYSLLYSILAIILITGIIYGIVRCCKIKRKLVMTTTQEIPTTSVVSIVKSSSPLPADQEARDRQIKDIPKKTFRLNIPPPPPMPSR